MNGMTGPKNILFVTQKDKTTTVLRSYTFADHPS